MSVFGAVSGGNCHHNASKEATNNSAVLALRHLQNQGTLTRTSGFFEMAVLLPPVKPW